MSRPLLAIAAIALLGAAGCGSFSLDSLPGCTDDSQCRKGQLCFPEGCGAPDTGIVVEVTANTSSGHHAQDFAVTNLAVTQDIEVFPPIALVGDIQQHTFSTQHVGATQPYKTQVTILASGESELIPGATRRYQATFTTLEQGAYSMFVGAGKYTLTATAADTSVPTDTHPGVRVTPGAFANQSFLFQSPDTAIELAAMLVKSRGVAPLRDIQVPVKMEVQAFDPLTRRALSQRAPVIKDDGSFTLWIDPALEKLERFEVVATPADPGAVAPSKTFMLTRPLPAQLVLEMGAFGQSLPGIIGTLLDAQKRPVGGATVFIEGPVGGGGTYRTRAVTSDDQGLFRVEAFLSAPEGPFTLTAIPPATGSAGIFRGRVKVLMSPSVEGYLEPNTFKCPARVTLAGTLLRPDGTPAARALVTAEPTAAIDDEPLPPSPVEGYTDDQGRYALQVDPAEYRLDYVPGEGLPRRSRFVSVPTTGGGPPRLELANYTLSNGRKVSGSISSPLQPLLPTTNSRVPNASVRYFRVTTIAGKRSSILLAESISDERGFDQVLLPTR